MPQLIIKGIREDKLQQLAPQIIETVAQSVECPEDWVTLELCPSQFFVKDGPTEQVPHSSNLVVQPPTGGTGRTGSGSVQIIFGSGVSAGADFFPCF